VKVGGLKEGLYSLLTCPRCGASPSPLSTTCPGCARSIVDRNGRLDLLTDDQRIEADRFSVLYRELRTKEGWLGPDGREEPSTDRKSLWKDRVQSISRAAQVFRRLTVGDLRPVIADVGAGSGWASSMLDSNDVIAIDISESVPSYALGVRADMRRLPIRTGTVDGILFAASLHYGNVSDVVAEAGRVLRVDGLMVIVDSPIYADRKRHERAIARSQSHYSHAGYPELANHYHPILAEALLAAVIQAGLVVERFDLGMRRRAFWRLRRQPPATFVVARRLP
jgi:SAM-dependent methyltransferase